MTEPKIIKDFPGKAVEAYRHRHGGALPGELQPCAHCGFDESSYGKEKHLHIVVCMHCGSRSPATATQAGAMTVWNARAPRPEVKAITGWKMVPVEPTKEMLYAGKHTYAKAAKMWSAMVLAAPIGPVPSPSSPPLPPAGESWACLTCGGMKLQPGVAYGISQQAVCRCPMNRMP